MKKIIILGLSFCLLLAACGQHTITPSEGEDLSNSVESTPLNTESMSIPSEQETKPAKELHPEMHTQSSGVGDYIETENAIYYNDRFRNRIYFSVDNGSHFYPLCSKANCTHSDKNCTASGYGVAYYKGSLYTTRFDSEADLFRIVQISLDGTDQGVIQTIPFPGGGGFNCYYHNGKAFLFYRPSGNRPLEQLKDRFFVTDLSTGELTEPLEELLQDGLRIGEFRFYNNIMAAQTGGTYSDSRHEQIRELYIDLNTWETKEYMQQVEAFSWYLDNQKLYYLVNHNKFFECSPEQEEGFFEQDLQTEEIVQCLKTDDLLNALYDEDYIYAMSYARDKDGQYRTLYIYTRDYELVDQKDLEKYEFLNYVSSERLFFSRDYDQGKLYCYMEKSDIGSGNMPIYDVNK
jgi:hypothetical protein